MVEFFLLIENWCDLFEGGFVKSNIVLSSITMDSFYTVVYNYLWVIVLLLRILVSDCAYPTGLERGVVPNEAFSASSWYDVDHEPWLARLYSREGEGAWCALENDGAQYLQVDLGQVHIITGVATQGKYEISEWAIRFRAWVTNFSLAFSDDQMSWTNYVEDGNAPKVRMKLGRENKIFEQT